MKKIIDLFNNQKFKTLVIILYVLGVVILAYS